MQLFIRFPSQSPNKSTSGGLEYYSHQCNILLLDIRDHILESNLLEETDNIMSLQMAKVQKFILLIFPPFYKIYKYTLRPAPKWNFWKIERVGDRSRKAPYPVTWLQSRMLRRSQDNANGSEMHMPLILHQELAELHTSNLPYKHVENKYYKNLSVRPNHWSLFKSPNK